MNGIAEGLTVEEDRLESARWFKESMPYHQRKRILSIAINREEVILDAYINFYNSLVKEYTKEYTLLSYRKITHPDLSYTRDTQYNFPKQEYYYSQEYFYKEIYHLRSSIKTNKVNINSYNSRIRSIKDTNPQQEHIIAALEKIVNKYTETNLILQRYDKALLQDWKESGLEFVQLPSKEDSYYQYYKKNDSAVDATMMSLEEDDLAMITEYHCFTNN